MARVARAAHGTSASFIQSLFHRAPTVRFALQLCRIRVGNNFSFSYNASLAFGSTSFTSIPNDSAHVVNALRIFGINLNVLEICTTLV